MFIRDHLVTQWKSLTSSICSNASRSAQASVRGVPAFPVDTHIHRLAARWGLSSGKDVVTTERDLKALFPEARWNAAHLQIIYFGRQYCPARGHVIAACPICAWAMAKTTAAAERSRGASK